MKLPPVQRFQKQNYPGSPEWFTRFISDINLFTETVWNILNNNITIVDNIDAQTYTQTVRAGATASANAFTFQSALKHTPIAILLGSVTDQTAYAPVLTSAVGIQWSVLGETVSIKSVTGLTNTHTYTLTLVLL